MSYRILSCCQRDATFPELWRFQRCYTNAAVEISYLTLYDADDVYSPESFTHVRMPNTWNCCIFCLIHVIFVSPLGSINWLSIELSSQNGKNKRNTGQVAYSILTHLYTVRCMPFTPFTHYLCWLCIINGAYASWTQQDWMFHQFSFISSCLNLYDIHF